MKIRVDGLMCLWNGQQQYFPLSGTQILGRNEDAQRAQISIPVKSVSRIHGTFITTESGTSYRDTGSTNGTIYNGRLLEKGEEVTLRFGDVLRIHGQMDEPCRLDVLLLCSSAENRAYVWRDQPLQDNFSEISIGREESLKLTDMRVSRHHASFFRASKGWSVIDHNSLNGVYVNNRRISEPIYLKKTDVVRIAGYFFVFLGDRLCYQNDTGASAQPLSAGSVPVRQESRNSPDPGSRLVINIRERTAGSLLHKKTLLKDIDLEIPDGSMVLVLGGSGAGKTTFMNAVMGYEKASGSIVYQGTDIYSEYEMMKYEIGYVPQQDLLRMNDLVYDTLKNSAQMRLGKTVSEEELERRVEETLDLFGLSRERQSYVGKLSGGQRKRLSIAVEYIGDPSLFFLDEPDSGLDGTMATELMKNLRAIADMGKIVMVISHSPDRAFEMFDKVIVLAKGSDDTGHLVFYGSPSEALLFFGVEALEKIVKRINRPDEGGDGKADEFIEKYARRRS